MSIFSQTNTSIIGNYTPIKYRLPKWLAWLNALLYPIEWLRLNFFNEYVNGSNDPQYTNVSAYSANSKVIGSDNAVYQALQNVPSGPGHNPVGGPTGYWVQIASDFRGAIERSGYNSQKLMLEFILNKWFWTTFRQPNLVSDIYITLNQVKYQFIVDTDPNKNSQVITQNQTDFVQTSSGSGTINFVIHVPDALADALGTYWQNIIRSIADQYVCAGLFYDVVEY